MPALLIRHRVTDYDTWEPGFAADADTRRAYGCRDTRLFRDALDPTQVLILLDWDDIERLRLFAQSDDLRETMARDEVADEPDLWLLEDPNRTYGHANT